MARRNQAAAPAASTEPEAPAVRTESKSKTVTIGCRIPNGVILRLFRMEDFQYPTPGGGFVTQKRAVPIDGREYTITGYAAPAGGLPRNGMPTIGGYALTHNIPRDFWEEWCKQNHDADLLKNHLLFCESDRIRAEDHARDHAAVRDNMGPLVEKDPRNPRPLTTAVSGIQNADAAKNKPTEAVT